MSEINNMRALLEGIRLEAERASLPQRKESPPSERNKVVIRPTLRPVNKQAAMIVSPVRAWIYQPFNVPDSPKESAAEKLLRAELKTARNENARLTNEVGRLRRIMVENRAAAEALSERVTELVKENRGLADEIQTLLAWKRLNT